MTGPKRCPHCREELEGLLMEDHLCNGSSEDLSEPLFDDEEKEEEYE